MGKRSTVKRAPIKKRVQQVAKAGAPDVPRPRSPYPKGPRTKLR